MMDPILEVQDLPENDQVLIEQIDYLLREAGECPTRDWNWVEIEQMEQRLSGKMKDLESRIGTERYNQILEVIYKRIEEDIKRIIAEESGFLGLLTKGLKDLIQEYENSRGEYSMQEDDSTIGHELDIRYATLYAKMHTERATKIIGFLRLQINKTCEP